MIRFFIDRTLLWKNIYYYEKKKLNYTTRCCTIQKHSTQSYAEISYLEALPCWVTRKSTAYIVLSFYAVVVKPARYLSMSSIILIINSYRLWNECLLKWKFSNGKLMKIRDPVTWKETRWFFNKCCVQWLFLHIYSIYRLVSTEMIIFFFSVSSCEVKSTVGSHFPLGPQLNKTNNKNLMKCHFGYANIATEDIYSFW